MNKPQKALTPTSSKPFKRHLKTVYAHIEILVTFLLVKILGLGGHSSLPLHAILTKMGGNGPFSLTDLSKPRFRDQTAVKPQKLEPKKTRKINESFNVSVKPLTPTSLELF